MAQAKTMLAAAELEQRRRVALIVAEAHLTNPAQPEELRLPTSADVDATNPFAQLMVRHQSSLANSRGEPSRHSARDRRPAARSSPCTSPRSSSTWATAWPGAGASSCFSPTTPQPASTGPLGGLPSELNHLARYALIGAAGKDLVDDASAKKAVAAHTAREGGLALPVGDS